MNLGYSNFNPPVNTYGGPYNPQQPFFQQNNAYNFNLPYNPPIVMLKEVPTQNFSHPNNPYVESKPTPSYIPERPTIRRDSPPREVFQPRMKKEIYNQERVDRKMEQERELKRESVMVKKQKVVNLDLPITTKERQFSELNMRYPKLHVPSDFTSVKYFWKSVAINTSQDDVFSIQKAKGSVILCDNFLNQVAKASEEKNVATLDEKMVKYNAKVMFGYRTMEDEGKSKSKHMWDDFKFLVGKKDKSGILMIGGSYVQEIDGDNPETFETMKRTAVRCVREYCGLDMSKCRMWHKFMEVSYHRPSEIISGEEYPEMFEKTTVFLITDVGKLFPSVDEYPGIIQKRIKDITKFEVTMKEYPPLLKKIPKDPSIFCVTQKKMLDKGMKSMMISLDGLLDYNRDDKMEKTFEVSLFAEAFKEMLQLFHGARLYKFFRVAQPVVGEKRRREEEAKNEEDDTEKEAGRTNKKMKIDLTFSLEEVKKSFAHFDRNCIGTVRNEELEDILLSMNIGLSKGDARNLVGETFSEDDSKFNYENLDDTFFVLDDDDDFKDVKEEVDDDDDKEDEIIPEIESPTIDLFQGV